MYRIMISAGEPSGDLHGAGLVRELKKLAPEVELFGIGGDRMKEMGLELLYHINDMGIVGFVEVLKHLSFLRQVFKNLTRVIKERRPQLLILIDYPGFNLKLASIASSLGVKVFYYIVPQIWAWGSFRLKKMTRLIDQMAVILPFEEEILQKAGIDARFVGHPLLEVLNTHSSRQEFLTKYGLTSEARTLGLLPGSRSTEVVRLFPEMMNLANRLKKKYSPMQVIIGKAPTVQESVYRDILNSNSDFKLINNGTYEVMKYSDLLIVASGTATLEAAFFGTPMIIVYKLTPISWLLCKALVKINNVGLVNIVAGKQVVPEFLQNNFKAEKILPVAETFLENDQEREQIRRELLKVKEKMGTPGASQRVAQMALDLIEVKQM